MKSATEWRAPSKLLGADQLLLRSGRLLLGLRSRQSIRLVDFRHIGFVPEVELDHHAVGIVHEDLLQGPRRHLPDLERHLVLLELVDGAADILAVDRDVVDGAAAMVLATGLGHQVEDRLLAGIEPGAGEVEGRTVAICQTDIALVEAHGGLEVLAVDIPVVKRECGHGVPLRNYPSPDRSEVEGSSHSRGGPSTTVASHPPLGMTGRGLPPDSSLPGPPRQPWQQESPAFSSYLS